MLLLAARHRHVTARVFRDYEVAGLLDEAELDARQEGDLIAFGVTPASVRNDSSGS